MLTKNDYNEKINGFIKIVCNQLGNKINSIKYPDFINICLHQYRLPIGPNLFTFDFLKHGNKSIGKLGDIAVYKEALGIVIEIDNEKDRIIIATLDPETNDICRLLHTDFEDFLGFRSVI